MKDQKDKIEELESVITNLRESLNESNLKVLLYEKMIELSAEDGYDVKKNTGMEQLERVMRKKI